METKRSFNELKVNYDELSVDEKQQFNLLYNQARKLLKWGIENIERSNDIFNRIEREFGGKKR